MNTSPGCDIGKRAHDGADRVGHRAQMDRQVRALRDHVAGDVENPAGVIAGDFQQRRIGGLRQHDLHFLGGRGQGVLDDLEPRGVGLQCANDRIGPLVNSCSGG